MEIAAGATPELVKILGEALGLAPADVYRCDGPLQISDLQSLAEGDVRPELRVEPLVSQRPTVLREAESIFPVIAQRDLLLHLQWGRRREKLSRAQRVLALGESEPLALLESAGAESESAEPPLEPQRPPAPRGKQRNKTRQIPATFRASPR